MDWSILTFDPIQITRLELVLTGSHTAFAYFLFCAATSWTKPQLLNDLQELPHIEHVIIVHTQTEQSMTDCKEHIQEQMELAHKMNLKTLLGLAATCSLSRSCKSRKIPEFCLSPKWSTETPFGIKNGKLANLGSPNIHIYLVLPEFSLILFLRSLQSLG